MNLAAKLAAVGSAGLVLASASLWGQTSLEIEKHTIDAAAGVKFEATRLGPGAWPDTVPLVSCKASQVTFEICVDLREHSVDPLGASVYQLAVRRQDGTGGVQLWRVRGMPEGEFQDGVARTVVHLRFEGGEEAAEIEFPIHSRGGPESLVVEVLGLQADALPVWVGRTKRVEVRARNLSDLPLEIRADEDLQVESDRALWGSVVPGWKGAEGGVIALGAKSQRTVAVIELKSKGWNCLRTSILPASHKDSPVTIGLTIPYMLLGDLRREAERTVPVRFLPSMWSMALALLCGALAASLVPAAKATSGKRLRKWAVGALGAFVPAICLAALGIVLVENKSELKVFDYSLDPYQLLSLFVIGLLSGLAPLKSRQKVEDWLDTLLGGGHG
jgi:hypothetical protein